MVCVALLCIASHCSTLLPFYLLGIASGVGGDGMRNMLRCVAM